MELFRNIILFIILSLVFKNANSLSCRNKCRKNKENCQNLECPGSFHLDVCGCCKVCSKQETETCGGPWDRFGRCEVGLACVRNPGDTTQQPGYCRTIQNGCYYNLSSGSTETQIAQYGTKYRTEDDTSCVCKRKGKWLCRLEGDVKIWYDTMEISSSGNDDISEHSSN